MQIVKSNIININDMFLVVKKTNRGYLYYNRYRQTGSTNTYYAHLFTQADAQAKLEYLQKHTKGKFSIISAKEVFCNSWRFDVSRNYNEETYSIKVSNDTVAVSRVKSGVTKPITFEKALAKLKADCEATINSNKKSIEEQLKQIKATENTIEQLKSRNTMLDGQTKSSDLEESLKQIVEKHTVPADIAVSVLFGKAE